MKKFVGWFDVHYGWEKKRIGGRLQKSATHDSRMIKSATKFVKNFMPDWFILGGDNLNCGFISRHNFGKFRLVEGLNAVEEYKGIDDKVLQPIEELLLNKLVWMKGNHEAWVDQFLDQNPTIEGLIEPEQYLGLADRGWTIVDYGEVFKTGKLHWVHGDSVRSSAMYRAKKMLDTYNKSVVSGHVHTVQMHLSTGLADMESHVGVVAPTMGVLNPQYLNNQPNNWCQGFVYGYVWPNGNFNVYPVIATRQSFAVEGEMYTP